jgi:ABC-type branched-subunit amino acid transport system ATPase component
MYINGNIQKSSVVTTQKSYCNIRKYMLQYPKKLIANTKKKKDVQTVRGWAQGAGCSSPGPSPLSSLEGGENRTLELAGTLATTTSLRSRGRGGEV